MTTNTHEFPQETKDDGIEVGQDNIGPIGRFNSRAISGLESAKSSVAKSIDSLADSVRERAPDGILHDTAVKMSKNLHDAGSYIKRKHVREIGSEIAEVMRRHPIATASIAFGIGIVFGRPRISKRSQ